MSTVLSSFYHQKFYEFSHIRAIIYTNLKREETFIIKNTTIFQSEKDFTDAKKWESLFDESVIEMAKIHFDNYSHLLAYYRCAIMEIETKLNVLNEEFSLRYDRNPINSIKSRIKRAQSVKEKLERKNLPFTLESVQNNIYDIAGVRVVCSFEDDVYTIAKALLSQDDISLVEEKDYIKNPKPNGYRSLHLIVSVPIFLAKEKKSMKVEIQLRTIAMDFWASLEHQLRYKKDFEFTSEMAKELLLCANMSAELDERMNNLRKKVSSDL